MLGLFGHPVPPLDFNGFILYLNAKDVSEVTPVKITESMTEQNQDYTFMFYNRLQDYYIIIFFR